MSPKETTTFPDMPPWSMFVAVAMVFEAVFIGQAVRNDILTERLFRVRFSAGGMERVSSVRRDTAPPWRPAQPVCFFWILFLSILFARLRRVCTLSPQIVPQS